MSSLRAAQRRALAALISDHAGGRVVPNVFRYHLIREGALASQAEVEAQAEANDKAYRRDRARPRSAARQLSRQVVEQTTG